MAYDDDDDDGDDDDDNVDNQVRMHVASSIDITPAVESQIQTLRFAKRLSHADLDKQELNNVLSREETASKYPSASAANVAPKSKKTQVYKWCAVTVKGRFDDNPIPAILFDDAAKFVRNLEILPQKTKAGDYYAIRFLGLEKDKLGDIFLIKKDASHVKVSSSMELVRSACSRVLTNKSIKLASIVLDGRKVTKDIPKRLNDITDKNDNPEACYPTIRDRQHALRWFDGDVYCYSAAPRTGDTYSRDKYFVRIDRTTGSLMRFQNCDAVGAYKPGIHARKLRSAKAASTALEANRTMIRQLRQRWKRFVKLAGSENDVPGSLEELKNDASRVHLGVHELTALLKTTSVEVTKPSKAQEVSASKPDATAPEEKPPKRPYNNKKNKRKDDSADSTAKKDVKRLRANETPENVKPWSGRTPPRVVVIGAGPAGLSAARCLKEHGIDDVVIFESRDRPGGRCHTIAMPALPMYDLPSINVDLGASFVHGCHDYNPLFVIAKKNKILLNTAGGGYSAGWGEKAPWYDATAGGRVKEKTVSHAFKLAQKVSERMFSVTDSAKEMDLLCSSSPNVSTPPYDDHKFPPEGLARALTENLNKLHPDSMFFSAPETSSLNAAFSEAKFDDAVVSCSKQKSQNAPGTCKGDCSLQDAFEYTTSCIVQSLLNGKKRLEALRPVYDCIPTVTWAYVAPMENLSFQVQREFNNEVVDAAEQLAQQQDTHQGTAANENSVLDARDADENRIDLSDGMVVNGYKHLLIDRVIGSGKNELNIKYKHMVSEVNVKTAGKGVTCVVKCADGLEKECDYVIVTVPLGVLKKKVIKFNPSLSDEKTKAIDVMGMGTENKVYMRFHEMFWPVRFRFIQCTDKRFRFLNLDMYGKKNTLLVHVSPPYAANFDGKSHDRDVVKEICEVLQVLFKLKMRPEPVYHHVTRWEQDIHAYGAYSYMPVGATTRDVASLAMPEYDGRVYFAGEACSVEGAQCVHGAVLTGNAAAVSILGLGNVDIDESKVVGESAGLQLESNVHSVQCSKCKRWRTRPAIDYQDDDASDWECRDGGKFNTHLGALGCAYR